MNEGVASGDRVVLLGDFNTTTDLDRAALRQLATRTGLDWSTAALPCTADWERDADCPGSALDHVLIAEGGAVRLGGACAEEGCEAGDRCPLWRHEVSDHCPVTVLPR